jgi:hypothetical protein
VGLPRRYLRHGFLLILVAAASPPGHAQAWLPDKGEASVTLTYNDVLNRHHLLSNGDELDVGHTRSKTLGLSAEYSPTDRLLLVAGIPYVQTQWQGEGHHGPEVDTGHWNHELTDLRTELHYQATEYPVAFAPYVALVTPTHHYPVLGHAAPGRHLKEYWVGFFVGKSSDKWPAYAQLRYNYAFVETVASISHDRSMVDLELGYFVTPRWALQAIASWQFTHGGIDVPVSPNSPLFPHHDQLAGADFFNLTGGLSWSATARTSFFANYTHMFSGRNAHKVDQGVTLGVRFSIPGR